jgi:ribose transport system permease protein
MATEASLPVAHRPKDLAGRTLRFVLRYYIQVLLVAAVVVLSAVDPNFRTFGNFENILLQSSFAGIGAVGMTFLIVAGAFDLSVAGILGGCGIVLALLTPALGGPLAAVAVVVLGGVLGLVNGLVVTRMRIPAFIATLGMMNVYLGLAFVITKGQVLAIDSPLLMDLGTSAVLGFVPIPFLVMVVVYVAGGLLMRRTLFGRQVRAVGSNPLAARTAGLPVDRVRILAFVLVGLCTAMAGVLLTGELSSANAIMATGYELSAIAIVVVGGTSLKGGSGTLFGSFTGALFFAVINNALNIFGVGAYWQYVVSGLLLITAIGVQVVRGYLHGGEDAGSQAA